MHLGLINSGLQQDGSYDYTMLFEDISGQLQAADIKIINQETILGAMIWAFPVIPALIHPQR